MLLVYRMPVKPPAGRVAVWRLLKKVGAIYLQQSVCVFPDNAHVHRELAPILDGIAEAAGEFHLLPLRKLDAEEEAKIIQQFQTQTSNHYKEIIENCEVNFVKEIEFETFRKNFTYEEAEEIRTEFDKILAWFERVRKRDWFGASNRDEAARWLERCESLVEGFEAQVFEDVESRAGGIDETQISRPRRNGRANSKLRGNANVAVSEEASAN